MGDGLRALFNPRATAFVGVSPDPMKYAGRALTFLRKHGFAGPIFAVNPKYREVFGEPCVADTDRLPEGEIDLAFLAVSANRVFEVIEKCGRKGIGAAIVASSGFREAGEEGGHREDTLRRVARDAGVRICGPNCIGIANLLNGVVASFGTVFESAVQSGHVGVISQSGAFASLIVDALRRRGLGVSHMVSSGNEADITTGEYLSYMIADSRTRVVLVYMEGIRDPSAFVAAAQQALAAGVPVVLLKTGRTVASRRAILSHTGSLAGDRDVEAAAFERCGIMVVSSIEEMTEAAMLGARLPAAFRPGRRIGVVCIGSGGAASLASDVLEGAGLAISALSADATRHLREAMPPFVTPQNPLDVAGYAFDDEAELAGVALDTIGRDPAFDKLLAVVPGLPHVASCVSSIERVTAASTKPVLTVFIGGPYTDQGIKLAHEASLPWSDDLERAGRVLAAATRFGEARLQASAAPLMIRSKLMSGTASALTEYETKKLLKPYGIVMPQERLCTTLPEAIAAAEAIGYPVALKVQSAALPHKSDVGGVALGIADNKSLRRAFETMRGRLRGVVDESDIAGYLVQGMATSGVEVFVGVKNDPTYGLTLLLGPGGLLVETMRDVAVGILPVTDADIERLIRRTMLERLFAGIRGRKPVNRAAVIKTVLGLTRFAADYGDNLKELDINPLIVNETEAVAVDALIVRYAAVP
ncbi:MAG: acetate--CoA ligase family protein [Pirellulaceae bacterium]